MWTHKKAKNNTLMVVDKNNITLSSSSDSEYEIVEFEILPEKMICPDCGGITLVGLDFCDKCAGELSSYESIYEKN